MANCKETGQGVFDVASVRDALTRVLRNPQFVAAPRLSSFLKFIVETTLQGDTRSIKAYTIATMALGRPESFDPAADAIVRVEANRLRTALTRYYAFDGDADTVIIELPRGGYVPSFRQRGMDDDAANLRPAGSSKQDPAGSSLPDPHAQSAASADDSVLEALIDEYRHRVSDIARNLSQIRDELTHARAAVAVSNTLIRIRHNNPPAAAASHHGRTKCNHAKKGEASGAPDCAHDQRQGQDVSEGAKE